jgi:catechol 2,3-dioxygenase-like lactoylglutathione lyase family enzyme
VPEFAVPAKNLDATLAFYQRLGFENAGSSPSDWDYLIIRRGDVQLHFYGDPDVDPLTTPPLAAWTLLRESAELDAVHRAGVGGQQRLGSGAASGRVGAAAGERAAADERGAFGCGNSRTGDRGGRAESLALE